MAQRLPADVLYLMCEQLAEQRDFATLLHASLASRELSQAALPWLYRTYHDAPVKGGGSESLPIAEQHLMIQKWSILWRSIILSAIDSSLTFLPYSRYARMLDLRDLAQLLEDDKFRGKTSSNFFDGSLSRFNLVLEGPGPMGRGRQKRQKRLHISAIINAIADVVMEQSPVLEQIAGNVGIISPKRQIGCRELGSHDGLTSATVTSKDLGRWSTILGRLRSLELWDGRALEEENTRRAIHENCPKFSSLSIYEWSGDRADADSKLAAFIAGLRPQSLESLEIISNSGVGKEALSSLCRHSKSLDDLRLHLERTAVPHLAVLGPCTSLTSIHLSEIGSILALNEHDKAAFDAVSSWLRDCSRLRAINLMNFVSGPALVGSMLTESSIQLERLELDGYNIVRHSDTHRVALPSQRRLRSLYVRGYSEATEQSAIDMFVMSLGQLEGLRELELRGVSDEFSNEDIISLVNALPELVDLYVSGQMVTDVALTHIGKLRNLRALTMNAFSSFTYGALANFICSLSRPGNEGITITIEMAEPEFAINDFQQQDLRELVKERLDGQFEYTLYREQDISDFEDLSD